MRLRNRVLIISLFFSIVMSLQANNVESLFKQGNKHFEKQEFSKAIVKYSKVIKLDKSNINAYYKRGISYFYTEQYDIAIADFKVVTKKDAKFSDGWNFLGLAISYTGDVDAAFKAFNKAVKLDPKFAEAYLNRGSLYVTQEKLTEAQKDFNKAAKYSPKNPDIFYQRGDTYKKQKKYAKAIKDYNKALKLGLKNHEIYFKLANTYYFAKEYNQSIKIYDILLKDDSDNIKYLTNKLIACQKANRTLESEQIKLYIEQLQNQAFPSYASLNYKTVSDESKNYIMKLPSNWYVIEKNGSLFISDQTSDKFKEQNLYGRINFMPFIADSLHKENPQDVMIWWETAMLKSGDNYAHYHFVSKKDKPYRGLFPLKYNKSQVQFTDTGEEFLFYDIAIVYKKHLFHANFQFKKVNKLYFEQIIDQLLKTIDIKLEK